VTSHDGHASSPTRVELPAHEAQGVYPATKGVYPATIGAAPGPGSAEGIGTRTPTRVRVATSWLSCGYACQVRQCTWPSWRWASIAVKAYGLPGKTPTRP